LANGYPAQTLGNEQTSNSMPIEVPEFNNNIEPPKQNRKFKPRLK